MKLIAGLGNPGNKYLNSRHNLGFMVIDSFVAQAGLSWQFSQDWLCFFAKNAEAVFVKPSTFMNKSGVSVSAVSNFYNIDAKDILVVYDELDLPFGKVRLAFNGVSAGHKGVDSVIESVGSVDFGRLRVGIGKPENPKMDAADYVLSEFDEAQKKDLKKLISESCSAITSYLADGIEATMNRFN